MGGAQRPSQRAWATRQEARSRLWCFAQVPASRSCGPRWGGHRGPREISSDGNSARPLGALPCRAPNGCQVPAPSQSPIDD
eukprot:15906942-Heterocapsa_arctica.AAC.1